MTTESPYKLRKATINDQDDILLLVSRVLSDYDLTIDPISTDKDLSDLESYYFENTGWFAVVEDNGGSIVGSYGIYRSSKDQCELRKMYLDPAHQGKGLGRLMMMDAEEKALEPGYTAMILETNRKLRKAMNLYKKFGFKDYRPSHLSDRCDIGMKKKL